MRIVRSIRIVRAQEEAEPWAITYFKEFNCFPSSFNSHLSLPSNAKVYKISVHYGESIAGQTDILFCSFFVHFNTLTRISPLLKRVLVFPLGISSLPSSLLNHSHPTNKQPSPPPSSTSPPTTNKQEMSSLANPVNWVLAAVLGYISYNYFTASAAPPPPAPRPKQTALVFREYTPKELEPFNGSTPDTRILMAVKGNVYDVTRGRNFYGPGTILFHFHSISCFFFCLFVRLEEERSYFSGTRIDAGGLTRSERIQKARRHNLAEGVTSRTQGVTSRTQGGIIRKNDETTLGMNVQPG